MGGSVDNDWHERLLTHTSLAWCYQSHFERWTIFCDLNENGKAVGPRRPFNIRTANALPAGMLRVSLGRRWQRENRRLGHAEKGFTLAASQPLKKKVVGDGSCGRHQPKTSSGAGL